MARSSAGVFTLALSFLLTGCIGAYQVQADNPTGAGSLTPSVEDRDAGLVGISSGFDLKSYQVIAVGLFPVTDPGIKDEGSRSSWSGSAKVTRPRRSNGLCVP